MFECLVAIFGEFTGSFELSDTKIMFKRFKLEVVKKRIKNISLLFITLFSVLAYGQKINCQITYLPTIRSEDKLTRISKNQFAKIDSLISLENFQIDLSNQDMETLTELYNTRDFEGNRIYNMADSTFSKILIEKKIKLDFRLINKISEKSIIDLISGTIDGAPFILTIKTKNNNFQFINNFADGLTFKNIREYLIFYFIYKDLRFCKNDNKLVEDYFSTENMLKNLLYCISRIESNL